jgi:hypothetical protein
MTIRSGSKVRVKENYPFGNANRKVGSVFTVRNVVPAIHEESHFYVIGENEFLAGIWQQYVEEYVGPIGDPDDSPVEHPKHYNSHPSGVECITIARHHNFNIGNVFKYLWRIGLKGEDAATKEKRVEEIDKAIFYLQDERARILA